MSQEGLTALLTSLRMLALSGQGCVGQLFVSGLLLNNCDAFCRLPHPLPINGSISVRVKSDVPSQVKHGTQEKYELRSGGNDDQDEVTNRH